MFTYTSRKSAAFFLYHLDALLNIHENKQYILEALEMSSDVIISLLIPIVNCIWL